MADLGFVGLGVMGGRIAKRLMDAGHRVLGTNRTRSKAGWLLAEGMAWAETPRAVAEASDVVFTMVTDAAALRAVTDGPDGLIAGLRPDVADPVSRTARWIHDAVGSGALPGWRAG